MTTVCFGSNLGLSAFVPVKSATKLYNYFWQILRWKIHSRQTKASNCKICSTTNQDPCFQYKLCQYSIYINDDLTKINQEVLSTVRLKDRNSVKKEWSHEGRIYVIYNQEGQDDPPAELQYRQYQYWLDLPWPACKTASTVFSASINYL
jgi:hypothetical protein